MNPRALVAAHNNAQWCDLVCRSNGVETVAGPGYWAARTRTPPFYPDAVTLARGIDVDELLLVVDDGLGCSIKDSAADLDLAARGFGQLFEASWLFRDAEPPGTYPLGWAAVRTATELADWATTHRAATTFAPNLLLEPSVRFLALRDGSTVRAGAILNRSVAPGRLGTAVGISNSFVDGLAAEELWIAVTACAAREFPGLPLVSYEQGADIDAALAAGFVVTGSLRVWMRAPSGS